MPFVWLRPSGSECWVSPNTVEFQYILRLDPECAEVALSILCRQPFQIDLSCQCSRCENGES